MSSIKSTGSTVSRTFLLEEDPSRSSNHITPKLFEIENTLRECGIVVDAEACQSCHSLLKILKRSLKVDVAIITQYNINSVLFRLKDRRTSSKSILISSDIDCDNKIDDAIKQKFRGNIKSVITSKIEFDYGQFGSLIALSSSPREYLTPADLAILQDVSHCCESIINYQVKTSAWSTSRSNLSLCSGLLGCLKPTLSELTAVFYEIKESWDEMNNITASTPLHKRAAGRNNVLDRYKKRLILKMERIELLLHDFNVTQKSVCSTIERILYVAKGYFLKDQETYIKTCSQLVGEGLVDKINRILKNLSKNLPTNALLWCFKVDSILAHAAHRTFYHHLILFLENIIYYWSRYCSTTQMFIVFEPVERNELPVRIPNALPTHPSNPAQFNEHGENITDYTYVIEGYIKVLLQFPDKRNPKFGIDDDNVSRASSHYTSQSKAVSRSPMRPNLTVDTRGGTMKQQSELRPPESPKRSHAAASHTAHSPRSAKSQQSRGTQSSVQSKATSVLRKLVFSLRPDEEAEEEAHREEDEEEEEEDEFDPDHPVHHVEPLLNLLNSSLCRLNEISTAKSVNILSESTKNQTEEAYFIRIPCLLYLTSPMDTAFLQYHGYKYNDFRFQKKKKRAGEGDAGKGASSKKQQHPHPRDRPVSGRSKPPSQKMVRKNSKHKMENVQQHAEQKAAAQTSQSPQMGLFSMFTRFACFSRQNTSTNSNAVMQRRKRLPTKRFVAVSPDPLQQVPNNENNGNNNDNNNEQQPNNKNDLPDPVIVVSPSISFEGGRKARR